jgi:hypothetical protein
MRQRWALWLVLAPIAASLLYILGAQLLWGWPT